MKLNKKIKVVLIISGLFLSFLPVRGNHLTKDAGTASGMIFKPLGVTSDVAGLVKVKNVKYSQGKIQVKLKASVKTTGRRQTHETLPTGKLVEFMAEKNIPISVSSQSVKNLELSFNLKI